MSVLIKGMKMPKSCWSCFCSAENVGVVCNITGDRVESQGRSDNCPLVEVPTPHGRLCDADAVKECLEEGEDCQDKEWALMLLNWAVSKRTVIEAEDE